MTTHYALMIDGVSTSARTHTVTAPYDDSVIATMDTADSDAIETALQTADALFKDKKNWLSVPTRIAILQKTAQIMFEQAEHLALEAAREGGKPLIDSRVEVTRAIDGIHNCIDCMRNDSGREIPMGINAASQGHLAFTRKEPIGIVVAVSAFNHPLNLIIHQVGPAVATGCPVIIKPAEDTPLSCYRFVSILREAGLPDGWCQALVTNNNDISTQLVSDARVGFFSFIGSAAVGWMLRSKLAAGARCALEHGGVAPVIIEADAALDDALPLLAKGGFYHAGQVCVSVQRIFCHHTIARDVALTISELGKKQVVGDPTSDKTDIGPLIRQNEVQRVHDWVTKAIADGAELLTGGAAHNNCYEPTVLFNPDDKSIVSQKEIFGPVICVYSYDTIDEALDRANALDVAFQAAVFTKDIDTALYVYSQLNASAVMINDHTAFRVDWMPFAGLRHSGLGVGGIPYTYDDMQIEKMAVIRSKSL